MVIAAEQLCKKVTSHYSVAGLTVDDVDGEEGGVGVEEVSSVFEVGVVELEGREEMSPV